MIEQKDTPTELANRFPEHASRIVQLMLKSNDFREIAEDYLYCIHKLNRLSDHPTENNLLIRHYDSTMRELEEEMRRYFMNE